MCLHTHVEKKIIINYTRSNIPYTIDQNIDLYHKIKNKQNNTQVRIFEVSVSTHVVLRMFTIIIIVIVIVNAIIIGSLIHRCFDKSSISPQHFKSHFILNEGVHSYKTRNANKVHINKVRTTTRMLTLDRVDQFTGIR